MDSEVEGIWLFDDRVVPDIRTPLPGPRAQVLLDRDKQYVSPSYTRLYPLVVGRGSGAVIEDVDGNLFLDFTAGIAVTATGHCHPQVVAAIQDQAAKLIHMSGTDFYYETFAGIGELQFQQVVGEVADIADIRKNVAHRHTNRTRRHFRVFQVRARSMSGDQQTHIDTVPYGIIQALTSVSRRRRL